MVKAKTYLIILLSIAVLLLLVRGCIRDRNFLSEIDKLKLDNYLLDDSVKTFSAKNDALVSYNSVLKIDREILINELEGLKDTLKNLKLKSPEVVIRTVTVTKYDYIPVPFDSVIPCPEFIREFEYDSAWLTFSGRVNNHGFTLYNIRDSVPLEYIIGERVTGSIFNRKKETIITAQSPNPHAHVAQLQGFVVTHPKAWHERRWVPFVAGAAAGIFAVQMVR